LLATFFALWHAAGVFGGQSYYAEDTAAYYVSNRSVHHAILSEGAWSFWDPLPGLGMPRLANIQNGALSPLSLLFYLAPAARVYSFYPAIVLSLLSIFTFALFRAKGLSGLAALFGALTWSTLGLLTTHVQHPPVMETLLWLPATLLAWQLALRSGRTPWVALAGLLFAFQIFGGSPQYILYNGLVMAVWMGADIASKRRDRPECLRLLRWAASIAVIGLGLGSWQLLPFLEFGAESHRILLSDAAAFAARYRAAPHEVGLALVAELFWWIEPPVMVHGSPYPNLPNLSLLAVAFAGVGLFAGARAWPIALAAGLFLLGMLGDAGGVTWLLSKLVPFADRLRAPYRMIVPAAFLIAWLSSLGVQRLLDSRLAGRRALALLALAWLALVGWTLKRPLDHYADPAVYRVPPALATADGRLVVDFRSSQSLPLFSVNAGLGAGVPTLLVREVLIPANFFEAWFASQLGSLEQSALVDRMIVSAALPLHDADAPMMRAFGLRTVARFVGQRAALRSVPGSFRRFEVIPNAVVLESPQARWARSGSPDWNPAAEAILAAPIEGGGGRASGQRETRIQLLRDEPDSQLLEVDSAGGLLVASALYYPGWRAVLDGAEVEVLEVDLALRGIALPPGRHRVRWTYRPSWFSLAWAGTLAALLVAGAWVGADLRGRQR